MMTSSMIQKKKKIIASGFLLFAITLLISACGPTPTQLQVQPTVTVNPAFQAQLMPLPTVPPYRCGAWASNNAPNAYSTISIFARLTKDIAGVSNAKAQAVVHFTNFGDISLDSQPMSDSGGYVSFTLSLAGRQPSQTPATVSVTFTVPGVKQGINCSSAFFTPQ
jgi:hypothetical protein